MKEKKLENCFNFKGVICEGFIKKLGFICDHFISELRKSTEHTSYIVLFITVLQISNPMLCWCFILIFIYKLLNAKYSLFLTHTVFIFKQVHFENCVMLQAVNILQKISIEQFVSCTCFLLKRILHIISGIYNNVCIYHNYGCVDKNMFFLLICFF